MKSNINDFTKIIFSIISVWFVFAMLLGIPFFAFAQDNFPGTYNIDSNPSQSSGNCEPGKLCNPIGSTSLSAFLGKIADAVLKVGVPIAAIFIIFAGFKFVTAAGDEKAIKDAKQIFWYTIIGTAILLGASLLAKVLTTTVAQIIG
ncbi:MAG: pilin [Candidatus Paceibacterota bacterium]|jgi:hypothetical protein